MISMDILSGKYINRLEANEPAYMVPSVNPNEYSHVSQSPLSVFLVVAYRGQWCSFCFDFAPTLILCAKCRVCLCSPDLNASKGCIVWDPKIHSNDFVFFCPYCTKSRRPSHPVRLVPLQLLRANIPTDHACRAKQDSS